MRRPNPVAVLLALLVSFPVLAGCISEGDAGDRVPTLLDATTPATYDYRYPGDSVGTPGHPVGGVTRITNIWDVPVVMYARPVGGDNVTLQSARILSANVSIEQSPELAGTTYVGGTTEVGIPESLRVLEPGESLLLVWNLMIEDGATGQVEASIVTAFHQITDTVEGKSTSGEPLGVLVHVEDPQPFHNKESRRTFTLEAGRALARPGDHVETRTVGLWLNGTSFYTNIHELQSSPQFPRGYGEDFGTDPLPIYVYGEDRSEQPVGSIDNCHFTTIRGYNALLRTQTELGTNARLLAPEEAYTFEGAEDHHLYGHPLIFINTIAKHHGATSTEDETPDPNGACFAPTNAQRKVPSNLPPVA